MREKDFEDCGKSILRLSNILMILKKFRSETSLLSPLQYNFNRVFLMTVVIVIIQLIYILLFYRQNYGLRKLFYFFTQYPWLN